MSEEKSFGFGFSEKPKAEEPKAVVEEAPEAPKPKKKAKPEPKKEEVKKEAPKPTPRPAPKPAISKAVEAEILYGAAKLRAKRGRG